MGCSAGYTAVVVVNGGRNGSVVSSVTFRLAVVLVCTDAAGKVNALPKSSDCTETMEPDSTVGGQRDAADGRTEGEVGTLQHPVARRLAGITEGSASCQRWDRYFSALSTLVDRMRNPSCRP